jgi:hypothetical protein
MQMHVDPLLSQLSSIRTCGAAEMSGYVFAAAARSLAGLQRGMISDRRCFCLMGVTMEDLYSDPSDLFVAGMAAGGSNVAVFSFHRYHPNLKMDPGEWYVCERVSV